MNRLDSTLHTALDEWRPYAVEPDWDDVLARAAVRRRVGVSRSTVAVLAVALGLLLSIPAFGVSDRLTQLITGTKRPGIGFRASVKTTSGATVGTFSLRATGLFVRVAHRPNPRPIPFRRPGQLPIARARWSLALERPATEARLERVLPRSNRHVLVARLCAPCSGKIDGRVRLRRRAFSALFGRRMIVSVRSTRGTASGVLRIEPPTR